MAEATKEHPERWSDLVGGHGPPPVRMLKHENREGVSRSKRKGNADMFKQPPNALKGARSQNVAGRRGPS